MTHDFQFYHGAVLIRLIEGLGKITIEPYSSKSNSSFIINEKIGIYIKYSKKRLTPWIFTFLKEHQEEIKEMKMKFSEVFIVFVCDSDGICCLNHEEFKEVLDENYEEAENVSIHRRPREQYHVHGRDGEMKNKIGDSDFLKKINTSLNQYR